MAPRAPALPAASHGVARVHAALHKRWLFLKDSLWLRWSTPRLKVLFPPHEGREADIRRSLRLTGNEIRFAPLSPETVRDADLVIPLDTQDLARLDALREHLPDQRIPIPSPASVELMNDKLALLEHLRAAGFRDSVARPRPAGTFPYVLKHRHGFGSHQVWIVHDLEEEQQLAEQIADPDSFTEKFLAGRHEYVTHCLNRGGRIVFSLTLRMRFGRLDAIKNKERPTLVQIQRCAHLPLFTRMLDSLGFEGISCFNYKLVDGRPVVFEINPRFGASLAPLCFRLLIRL